jgi:RND family efflux transporter MFP subunit
MTSKQDHPMQPKPRTKRPGSSKKLLFPLAVLVVLIITGVISGLIPRWRQHTEQGAAARELSIPTVTVVSPKPEQPMALLPLAAEIKPWSEAFIYARANGYLKRRLVDIGSYAQQGQLLAEIDSPELYQELERARAQLAQAQATLELAKITASRWTALSKESLVSEQDNAEKQADLKLKTAFAASAGAEVRRLEKLQAFTRVTAPFAGTITVRNVDSGDLISAGGGKELFHLAQTHRLRVFVQVPQAMARSIGLGQSAEMSVPELSGRQFQAKVIRTAGVIAVDSRTLLVELEVDNSKGEILAGSFAQVRFSQAGTKPMVTLPSNTIMFRGEGPRIGVVQEGGKVEVRTVKVGRDFGQTIEIIAGVDQNERVIINPSESLVSGCTVAVRGNTKPDKGQ